MVTNFWTSLSNSQWSTCLIALTWFKFSCLVRMFEKKQNGHFHQMSLRLCHRLVINFALFLILSSGCWFNLLTIKMKTLLQRCNCKHWPCTEISLSSSCFLPLCLVRSKAVLVKQKTVAVFTDSGKTRQCINCVPLE